MPPLLTRFETSLQDCDVDIFFEIVLMIGNVELIFADFADDALIVGFRGN